MGFLLTEDQQQIRQTARDFMQRRLPVAHLRQLRDSADPTGFSREAWRELAAAMLTSSAATVADLPADEIQARVERLWIVPPGGSLLP